MQLVRAFGLAPVRWVQALRADIEPPTVPLDLKFKHLHRIHLRRDELRLEGSGVLDLGATGDGCAESEVRYRVQRPAAPEAPAST